MVHMKFRWGLFFRISVFLLFLITAEIGYAQTNYQVGPTRTYVSPNALYAANVLQDGDIIEIDAADYEGQAALANWQNDDLIIRGVGGRPHLKAQGQYILGKGIWVLGGNDITVENIEFSGATVPDENGAGIRLDGVGMTVRNCYFHDNENGILTNPAASGGDILIEYTEFDNNGFGDGFTHNLYINQTDNLTFRYNYSHHAKIGHNLKSRARTNFILYNRIMDEDTGNSSRLIDLPNGGFSIVMGNLLMQGPNAPNNNLIGYGLEGLSNPSPHELYVVNNTAVNKRTASSLFLSVVSGASAHVSNNILAGIATFANGTVSSMSNNLEVSDIASVGFVDEPNYDYSILQSSAAVDGGIALSDVNGQSLTPTYEYEHVADSHQRSSDSTIDIGAYEYVSSTGGGNTQGPCERPGPNNTGPTGTLQASSGITITQDGAVYDGYDFSGTVTIEANNVTLRNFKITTTGIYGVNIKSGYTGTLLEDGEISGMDSSGVLGSNFTARRLYIFNSGADGFKPGSNVLIEGCWIRQMGYKASSHADGVQMRQGSGLVIRHNYFDMGFQQQPGYNNSICMIIQTGDGPVDNVLIENNWISGAGSYAINIGDKGAGYGPPTNVRINNNKFYMDSYQYGIWTFDGSPTTAGNMWAQDNMPVDANQGAITWCAGGSGNTPMADAGADMQLGCTASVVLDGSGSSSGTTITYSWSTTDGNIVSGGNTNQATVDTAGTYSLTATDTSSSESATDDVVVTEDTNPPSADAGEDVTIDLGESAQLNATGGVSYVWSPATGLDNPNIVSPNANPTETSTYTVTVTGQNGCTASDEVVITVNDENGDPIDNGELNLSIRNAFSPNGDGVNDTWHIQGAENYPDILIKIFSRNGQEIFQSNGTQDWDGAFKGKELPIGAYYYMVSAEGKEVSGVINLIR